MNCARGQVYWKKITIVLSLVLLLAGLHCSGLFAEEKNIDSFDSTEALIKLLKQKGIIDDDEAKGFLQRHREKTKETSQIITILPAEDQEEYIKNVSKGVTEQLTKDLNNLKESYEFRSDDLVKKSIILQREVDRLEEMLMEEQKPMLQKSSWAQRIRFGGDIRLRHESVLFDDDNAQQIQDPNEALNTYINSSNDEHRQRIRLRVGLKAKLIDPSDANVGKVDAEVRIATGSVNNPVSTNYTLGSASSSNSDIILDRAYLKYTWEPEAEIWGGKIPQVSLTGGVMKNPWMSTSLVWDSDLSFEGVSAKLVSDTNELNSYSSFLTMGYFPLEDSEWFQSDKYLLGGQIGFEHRPKYGWKYSLSAAYYEYLNIENNPRRDTVVDTDSTRAIEHMAPKYMQKGNSIFDIDQRAGGGLTWGLLSDFELLNITGRVENYLFFPIHVILYADWVKNLGYDPQEMADKTLSFSKEDIENDSGDIGYQIGLKIGYPKPRERWNWNIFVAYRYLESDAVLDAFTDSDFHGGGTNAKGYILGGELGLYHNVWLSTRWMSANEITDMDDTNNPTIYDDLAIDTFQFNINAAF